MYHFIHTNEINQGQITFHIYNYIYKREKKKDKKDIFREKRSLPLFSDRKFQFFVAFSEITKDETTYQWIKVHNFCNIQTEFFFLFSFVFQWFLLHLYAIKRKLISWNKSESFEAYYPNLWCLQFLQRRCKNLYFAYHSYGF